MAETQSMSWDDVLDENEAVEQQKQNDFVLLPDGEYGFVVKKLEKDFYTAKEGGKMPSCPVAKVHLLVRTDDGEASYFRESLFLHSGNKWQLFQFFTCLGLRKHGDGTSKMPWDQVEGAGGFAQIGHREYQTKDGEKKITNCVKKWIDPSEGTTEDKSDEDDYS